MRRILSHTIEMLINAATLAVAMHLFLILYLDGYAFSLLSMTIEARRIAVPTILFMLLILLRFPIRARAISGELLSTHAPAIFFGILLSVYLANGVTKASGDTAPARYLPLSILREGNFDLNEFPFLYAQEMPYYLRQINGRYVSNYPVGPALSALPFYLISALGHVALDSRLLEDLEKLAAASLVALSASILYVIVRRLSSRRLSLLIIVTYALGTSSLSVSSQALWQHGPSQLALMAALYSLVRGRNEPRWIGVAGFALAFAIICRPTNLLLALPLSVYVLLYHRAYIGRFALGGLPLGLFQLWYNGTYFGDPFFMPYPASYWSTLLWEGLPGIVISPGRGLFVYSPIFLCSFVGMALAWRRNGDPLLRALSVGILPTVLLYGQWINWWGGFSYGPRLLADLTPALSMCLVPLQGLVERNRCIRWTFLGLAAWSIWAHALGAFWDDGRWNASPIIDLLPDRNWAVRGSPLVEYSEELFGRAWIAIRRLPTSQSAAELLSATYRLDSPPSEVILRSKAPQCPLRLCITARNSGQSVWLSTAKNYKGAVILAWRWIKEGKEVPGLSGAEPLRHDVFPGASYEFQMPILPVPSTPGGYLLELGMLNEGSGRFSDHGVAPVIIPILVPTWTPETLQQYLNTPLVRSTETPTLSITLAHASYRRGNDLRVSLELTGAEKPVLSDTYLALLRPDGHVDFLSGEQLMRSASAPIPAASRAYIRKRSRFSSAISLHLVDELPPGAYTIYVFITEASSYQMLAKASARFGLEP